MYITRDWESIALLIWPYQSCHCRGSQWFWHNFHSGSGSFLVISMASADVLIRLAFSAADVGVVWCSGPAQNNDIGAVRSYYGCKTGKQKDGAMLAVVLKGLTGILSVAAWLLLIFCGGVDCKFWWLMAWLAVLGGRVGWKLLKPAAIFVAWHMFVVLFWGKRHKFRLKLHLRWTWVECTVFCCELSGTGG